MVRQLTAVAGLALLAGCGGSSSANAPRSAPTASPAPKRAVAPVLVELIQQRPGALIDKIAVRTDGTAHFDRPSGGVGRVQRDVVVADDAMRRLRRGLARVGDRRLHRGPGRPAPNGATYLVRFGGRTVVARQGVEPRRMRGPVHVLAGLLVGEHVTRIVDERLGGVAGSTHAVQVRKASPLVYFQRQGEAGATLDTITVRADGTATLQKRHGGAGGRFKELRLRAGELPRLRRDLARLPSGSSLTRGSPPPLSVQYLLRLHGRTLTAREGGIVPAGRPAIRRLERYIDGIGVREVKTDVSTHRP